LNNTIPHTGKVRIKIPKTTLAIYNTAYSRGDFAAISVHLCGSELKAKQVARAISSGEGPADIVNTVVKYYRFKKTLQSSVKKRA